MKPKDISIIIVNYNSNDFLYNCVQSLINNISNIEFEIIIVDNNSTDSSLERCKSIKDNRINIIRCSENYGFSRANNIGIKYTNSNIIHFLNPDTQIRKSINNDYEKIINNYHQGRDYVYVNPLHNRDGSTRYEKQWIPTISNYLLNYFWREKTRVYYIGASVIISKLNFQIIGKWNENYFMYCEDTELFYQLNRHKIPVIELPSIIDHYGGGSSENSFSSLQKEIIIQKSLKMFYKLNRTMIEYWIMQFLILLMFIKRPKRLLWQIKAIYKSQ